MRHFEPYTEFRLRALKVLLKTPQGEEVFVEIGPGSSFGAGHKTTHLCLKGIQEIFTTERAKDVLDLGCGSGVLAISAAVLGAESVLAIDIDPVAVEEATENVKLNGTGSRVRVAYGSLEDVEEKFDLVLANVVTKDLLLMREKIKSVLREGGILLASGISELNKGQAVSGFGEVGLSLNREFVEDGWAAVWFDLGNRS